MYGNQKTILREIQEQSENEPYYNNNKKQFGLKVYQYLGISAKLKEA